MGNLMVTGVTFAFFMTEAIIHYNMGKAGENGGFQLSLPPPKELAKIAAVTGAFSVVSGFLTGAAQKRFGPGI